MLITTKNTPLHLACEGSHVEAARALLAAGASPTIANAFGNSPLHSAIMAPRPSVALVQLLLERGADASWRNHKQSAPLNFVAYSAFSAADKATVCDSLRAQGADVTSADEEGMTPLHVAARCVKEHLFHSCVLLCLQS